MAFAYGVVGWRRIQAESKEKQSEGEITVGNMHEGHDDTPDKVGNHYHLAM